MCLLIRVLHHSTVSKYPKSAIWPHCVFDIVIRTYQQTFYHRRFMVVQAIDSGIGIRNITDVVYLNSCQYFV